MEETMIVAGIDMGTKTAKAVLLREGHPVAASCFAFSGGVPEAARKALEQACQQVGLSPEAIEYLVATGLGKEEVRQAQEMASDMACHARGAHYRFPSARTILDIGAENCRGMRCDPQGNLAAFSVNDKCASGTGIFLETMARLLEIGIEQMGPLSLGSQREVSISTMCAVFAESEVISEVHRGTAKVDIVRGIHDSVALRGMALLNKVGVERDVVMTGGVARDVGMVAAMTRQLGFEPLIPQDPQEIGALGAALWAMERRARG
ncbi:MAG: 2-hydroxyglutaryl-CoA dehydratase [Candidatus Tectomicrobia bacterium]|uniref:2-hydroxyglutaryl-CoA dehydratase n=1 Tax=Tectimicrobiota bacterium TaxID=2528274 RepID=A0A932CP16_UNCTE|nr:2-hydroxyglutaryl-CoA dehydratase [Candidatus Tectomicrobia bacterium]